MFNHIFKEHISSPRNFGEIKDADMFAQSNPSIDGDLVQMFIKLGKGGNIEDIKFRTFVCSMCIGASSYLTELVMGKTVKAARKLNVKNLAPILEGVPEYKLHCHNLALNLLHSMIDLKS